MALKTFVAGEVLTADDTNIYLKNVIAAVKTSDESVSSSTTLQDDDELVLTLAADSTYWIEGVLSCDGGSTGDIKLAFTGPSGASIAFSLAGLALTGSSGTDDQITMLTGLATTKSFGLAGGLGTPRPVEFKGICNIASTAGDLQLQWAQNTSDGSATRVRENSAMWATRIS